jgi:uncharacterized protein (DUF58 family)
VEREDERLEVVGDLDAAAAEALRLEIRRLARRHGVAVLELRIDRQSSEPGSA